MKYKMVGIKLQLCGHYGHPNPDEFETRVQCLFILCALHACENVMPFCAILEELVL